MTHSWPLDDKNINDGLKLIEADFVCNTDHTQRPGVFLQRWHNMSPSKRRQGILSKRNTKDFSRNMSNLMFFSSKQSVTTIF